MAMATAAGRSAARTATHADDLLGRVRADDHLAFMLKCGMLGCPPETRPTRRVRVNTPLARPDARWSQCQLTSNAMAASDAVPVIVGAAIGAGGAVIAQITSAVFTSRRERRQLDWNKERQAREWKMREDERFLSLKQELYTSYSVLANQFWATADSLTSYDGKDESEKPKIPDWDELERLERNIQLIAPEEVSGPTTDCFAKLLEAVESGENKYKDKSQATKQKAAHKALEAWWIMNRAMRADLHGPQGHFTKKPSTNVDLPSDPKPAHVLPWWRSFIHRVPIHPKGRQL